MPPSFVCETCGYTTAQKIHYDTHKARKKPCLKQNTLEERLNALVVRIGAIEANVQKLLAHTNLQENVITTSHATTIVKPFIKWVGGKTQILEQVLERFPTTMVNYHEPFLGGGSVLLGMLSERQNGRRTITGKVYASDLNANLVALYKNIQSAPDALIREVRAIMTDFAKCPPLPEKVKATAETPVKGKRKGKILPASLAEAIVSQEAYYYWIRSRFNAFTKAERTSVVASAMLLFMNKTCFRGVYRERADGGINVPFGSNKNPSILDEEHIRTVSALIRDVVFTQQPFADALATVQAGDFVYLDPPYAPENDTSFVGYTADGFGMEEHKALFKLCNDMTAKNVKLLMSNAAVPFVRTAFPAPAYTTHTLSCRRAIHSKEPDARTDEVLITN